MRKYFKYLFEKKKKKKRFFNKDPKHMSLTPINFFRLRQGSIFFLENWKPCRRNGKCQSEFVADSSFPSLVCFYEHRRRNKLSVSQGGPNQSTRFLISSTINSVCLQFSLVENLGENSGSMGNQSRRTKKEKENERRRVKRSGQKDTKEEINKKYGKTRKLKGIINNVLVTFGFGNILPNISEDYPTV